MPDLAETPSVDIQDQKLDGLSILDKAVVLQIEFHRFGLTRKASLTDVQVEANKDYLRLSKVLLKCREYDAVVSYRREITEWLRQVGLPFTLRSGSYLVPLSLVVPVEEALRERRTKDQANVAGFLSVYTKILARMNGEPVEGDPLELDQFLPPAELGVVYRPEDYPSVAVMATHFSIDWQWLDYGVANRLEQIDAELFKNASEKLNADIVRAAGAIEQGLMASMYKLVASLKDTLTPNEDGTRKRFYKSTVTKIQDFLSNIDLRNLTGSKDLAQLAKQAKNLVEGVDPDVLKDDEALRNALQVGFGQIESQLAGFVDTSTRRIEIEGDEPEGDAADGAAAASA